MINFQCSLIFVENREPKEMVSQTIVGGIILWSEHYFPFSPSLCLGYFYTSSWHGVPSLVWCPKGSPGALAEHHFSSPWTLGGCLFCGSIDVGSPVAYWITSCQHLENQVSSYELGWIQQAGRTMTGCGAAFLSICGWRKALECRECHAPADLGFRLFQGCLP